MAGFKAYIRYLLGLDQEVRVSDAIDAWTRRLVATRELEVEYVTEDVRGRVKEGWEDGPETEMVGDVTRGEIDEYFATRVRPPVDQTVAGPILQFGTINEVLPEPEFGTIGTVLGATVLVGPRPSKPSQARPNRPKKRAVEHRSRIVREAAAAAKVKFGLPKATEANLLVVSKYIRDWLDDHGVRPTHIEGITPHAVALVFIPTRADIEMKEMLAAPVAVAQQRLYEATYFSDSPRSWWRPSTWFGRAYARPFTG